MNATKRTKDMPSWANYCIKKNDGSTIYYYKHDETLNALGPVLIIEDVGNRQELLDLATKIYIKHLEVNGSNPATSSYLADMAKYSVISARAILCTVSNFMRKDL